MSRGWSCPAIYGPNGDPYAAENNGFDSGSGRWFRVCVKNPWREPINPQALVNYETTKREAQSSALALSEQWNRENPGLQKCFQWGPLTSPTGGTESGGVCANVIGTSISSSSGVESSTASSSDSLTAVSSSPDPLPQYASGQEIPGTRISGQVNIECPAGSGSAIEVNATTKAVFTFCVKNWVAILQPITGIETRTAASALETSTVQATASSDKLASALTTPVAGSTNLESATATLILEPIDLKGSIRQITEIVEAMDLSSSEEKAIVTVTTKLASIKSTSKLVKIALPNSPFLKETAKSLTPSVCKISGLVVQPKKTGTCQITYTFEGESGSIFESTKKVSFKK